MWRNRGRYIWRTQMVRYPPAGIDSEFLSHILFRGSLKCHKLRSQKFLRKIASTLLSQPCLNLCRKHVPRPLYIEIWVGYELWSQSILSVICISIWDTNNWYQFKVRFLCVVFCPRLTHDIFHTWHRVHYKVITVPILISVW